MTKDEQTNPVHPPGAEVLFTNFQELTGFRNNYTPNLKLLGEHEPTWLYLWVAHTRDHQYIPNIERDGTVNRFQVVLDLARAGNLDALYLVPRVSDLPTHKVIVPPGAKPICVYRTAVTRLPSDRVIRYVQYYLLGFEQKIGGKMYQCMRIIKPGGEFRDTTNFKLRWHSEKDEVDVPAILFPRGQRK